MYVLFFFFFFSSRRRHTRSLCDWSSDVCSSDLLDLDELAGLDDISRQLKSIDAACIEKIGRASLGKSVDLGGRRIIKKKKKKKKRKRKKKIDQTLKHKKKMTK